MQTTFSVQSNFTIYSIFGQGLFTIGLSISPLSFLLSKLHGYELLRIVGKSLVHRKSATHKEKSFFNNEKKLTHNLDISIYVKL